MVVIFDLDGVVYLGNTPLPDAIEALNALAEVGHEVYFLTNNSTRSRPAYVDRLGTMGFATRADHVITSAFATGLYLQSLGAQGSRVLVVGEEGLAEEMAAAGMEVVPYEDPEPVQYVVAGLDRRLTYAKLQRAHREITERGAAFIATNQDATYPHEAGEIPGGGAIVAPIAYSTGVTPVTIGKPEPHAWRRILGLCGAPPEQALMVGDRAETDIRGARSLGIHTALVLTGVTRPSALPGLPPEHRPDYVIHSLAEVPAIAGRLAQ
ncbi:MAG: HAD-IIA family hydrolase, partial [Armatimonadetes bacterium]|nr:HAD-IIA family hydrolase [Armatimonadota bacterium]